MKIIPTSRRMQCELIWGMRTSFLLTNGRQLKEVEAFEIKRSERVSRKTHLGQHHACGHELAHCQAPMVSQNPNPSQPQSRRVIPVIP